ncbi:hypothetical protein [Paraglaciecola sp. 2405UD69-4]|uniref:hypothetical protein n=1 Tax=Paraglaciecola sp. 2405UD69-4 TaxID=3391836 RepID=UPI0039C9D2BE
MKLLVVTGITHSNWMKYIDAMEIPFPVVSAEIQSELEALSYLYGKKTINAKIKEITEQLDSVLPQIVYLPDCSTILGSLLKNESVKSLVLYSDPVRSIANGLAEDLMTENDCLLAFHSWKKELKSLFEIYRKHKSNCLLLNCQEAFEKNNKSQSLVSAFMQSDVKIRQRIIPVSQDKLLAAMLIKEDVNLFAFYEEARKNLPSLEQIAVSTSSQYEALSSLAFNAIEEHRSILKKQEAKLEKIEKEQNGMQLQCIDLLQQKQVLQTNIGGLFKNISELNSERDKLITRVADTNKNCELQVLQINQLEEELEMSYKTLESDRQNLQQLDKKLIKQKESFAMTEKNLKNDIAKLSLQIASTNPESESQNIEKEKIRDLAAENKLNILQISQLQEELEYYFQKLQEKDSAEMSIGEYSYKPVQKVYDKCSVKQAEILAGYSTEGYRDIQLKLNQVAIADGRVFESVYCKLLEVDGRLGIEFRPVDGNFDLTWIDELNDDYGNYITYIPNPSENQLARQHIIDQSLNASDRLAIISIASLLYDAMQTDDLIISKEMLEGELRDWRLNAIELKNQIGSLPVWLSFDHVLLIEELRTEGYEHLWFKFEKLLINDQYFPEFDVKFAATGDKDEILFTDQITLELRELASGYAPLQAWPPEIKDNFGYKFQVNINLLGDSLNVSLTDKVSKRDKQLIRHLIKNINNFIQAITDQGTVLSRDRLDWMKVGSLTESFAEPAPSDSKEHIEAKVEKQLKDQFQFAEFVDLGGYQHLIFDYAMDDNKLKLKVRVEDINFENGQAKVALELRTGDELVPLANSDYFAEDDYGPRVLIDLSDVEMLISDETLDIEHRALLQGFIGALPDLIETIQDIDDQAQINWISWISE